MSNPICKVCQSQNTEPDIVVDNRQRYKCCDCRTLFFCDVEEEQTVPVTQPKAEVVEAVAPARAIAAKKATEKVLTEELKAGNIPPESQVKVNRETYLGQHRDEILADRLVIGHGRTLTKWNISGGVWLLFKYQCEEAGVEVPNLIQMRSDACRLKREELEKGNIPMTPTVREETEGLTKEILIENDVLVTVGRRITLGQLEEILRELEWLRGYKEAVLDIIRTDPKKLDSIRILSEV